MTSEIGVFLHLLHKLVVINKLIKNVDNRNHNIRYLSKRDKFNNVKHENEVTRVAIFGTCSIDPTSCMRKLEEPLKCRLLDFIKEH